MRLRRNCLIIFIICVALLLAGCKKEETDNKGTVSPSKASVSEENGSKEQSPTQSSGNAVIDEKSLIDNESDNTNKDENQSDEKQTDKGNTGADQTDDNQTDKNNTAADHTDINQKDKNTAGNNEENKISDNSLSEDDKSASVNDVPLKENAKINISIGENSRSFSGKEAGKIVALLGTLKESSDKTLILSEESDWTIEVNTEPERKRYTRVYTSKGWIIYDTRNSGFYEDLPELERAVIDLMSSDEEDGGGVSFVGYSIDCTEPVTEAEYLETATKTLDDWLEQLKGSEIDDYYRNTGFKIEGEEKSSYLACGMVNGRKEFVCELCFTALGCGKDTFYDNYRMEGSYTLGGKGWDGNYIRARFRWENGKCIVLKMTGRYSGSDIDDGLNGISRSGYKNFFEFARRPDMEEALEENYAGYEWSSNIVSKNLTQTSDGIPVNINIYLDPGSMTSEDEDTITGIWDFSSGMNGKVVYSTGVYFTDNGTGHMEDTLPRSFKLVFDNYNGDGNPDYCIRYMDDEDGTYYNLRNLINDGRVLNLSGRAFEGGIYVAGCFEPSTRLQKTEEIAYIGWKKEDGEYYPTDTNGNRIVLDDLNMYSDRYFLPDDMRNYAEDENFVTCFLWNNTEKSVKTDAEYSIEIYEKGQWKMISKGLETNSVSIPARGYAEISYDISSLPERKHALYRIVQRCEGMTAYGKFICDGEEIAGFSARIETILPGKHSINIAIIDENKVKSPELETAILKTENGDVQLSVVKLSGGSYQAISTDIPEICGTYNIVLNDTVNAELRIEDIDLSGNIEVDAQKLEDGISVTINSDKDLRLGNIYIMKKKAGIYDILDMAPERYRSQEVMSNQIKASEPYTLKLIDYRSNYFSDDLIHEYYEAIVKSDNAYYEDAYSEYGITKDMTEEEFTVVLKDILCYTPDGTYLALISFYTDEGNSISLTYML